MDDYYERPPSRRAPPPRQEYYPPRPPQKGYVVMFIVGIIILMVAGIIYVSWGYMNDPDNEDDSESYSDNVRIITTTGNLLQYIGISILCIGLFLGAMKDEDLHQNVRLGMLIAIGLIISFNFI